MPHLTSLLLCADLSSVLGSVLAELTSFLRKANRQLRQAALTTLEVGWVHFINT